MRNRREGGFTIIEVLFGALFTGLMLAGFFYALSTGELSSTLSSAKADLQAEVRRTMDWIVKDVRQTVSWDMANNSPSDAHIKFRQVDGWDTVNNLLSMSANSVEYSYDAASEKITRKSLDSGGNVLQVWTFNNITASPFYTRDATGSVVALNSTDLLTSGKLIASISGQKQVRGSLNTSCSLSEEIKIRNE